MRFKPPLSGLFAVWVGGCASAPAPTPVDVAWHHVEAARAGDAEQRPSRTSLRERERSATWGGEGGIELVREGTRWRIHSGVLGLGLAYSREACLALLAEAIEARDGRRLGALLPESALASVGADRLSESLALPAWQALAAAIRAGRVRWGAVSGERARAEVEVGGRVDTIELVVEGKDWKVFDVRPWRGYLPR